MLNSLSNDVKIKFNPLFVIFEDSTFNYNQLYSISNNEHDLQVENELL